MMSPVECKGPVRFGDGKFFQALRIPSYFTDARQALDLACFMRMAQETAYWAAESLGFGYDTLHAHRTAWVLCRMHIHCVRMPSWREEVTLSTWHKGALPPYFLRDFQLHDAGGALCMAATSSWVVMDEQSRRLVRPEDMDEVMYATALKEDALPDPCPKVVFPSGGAAREVGGRTARPSDIDLVGHVNNARYMAWALDALAGSPDTGACALGGAWEDVYIQFNKETRLGETVSLWCAREESGCKVCGKVQGEATPRFVVLFCGAARGGGCAEENTKGYAGVVLR